MSTKLKFKVEIDYDYISLDSGSKDPQTDKEYLGRLIENILSLRLHPHCSSLEVKVEEIPGQGDNPLVCKECGSTNIQTQAWVDANTNEYRSDGCGDSDDNWCEDCNEHTKFTTKNEFEKMMDDWAREHGLAWTEDTTYEQKRETYNKLKTAPYGNSTHTE